MHTLLFKHLLSIKRPLSACHCIFFALDLWQSGSLSENIERQNPLSNALRRLLTSSSSCQKVFNQSLGENVEQFCLVKFLVHSLMSGLLYQKKLKREGSKFSLFGLSQKEQWSATFLPFSLLPFLL